MFILIYTPINGEKLLILMSPYTWLIFFFVFLGPHPWHMQVPRLGVESAVVPSRSPQQYQIWASSVTYTTARGNPGSLTHWASPGIEPASSWLSVRFVFAEPHQELPPRLIWNYKALKIFLQSNENKLVFCFLYFFFFGCRTQGLDVGSQFLDQGLNLGCSNESTKS